MEVKAWNNGKHCPSGGGYGVKINMHDRDKYFDKSWKIIFIKLPGISQEVKINIEKVSFWEKSCGELINKEIGCWLINNGYVPWPFREPPEFSLTQLQRNHFMFQNRFSK